MLFDFMRCGRFSSDSVHPAPRTVGDLWWPSSLRDGAGKALVSRLALCSDPLISSFAEVPQERDEHCPLEGRPLFTSLNLV
jgi:hypothetical protein